MKCLNAIYVLLAVSALFLFAPASAKVKKRAAKSQPTASVHTELKAMKGVIPDSYNFMLRLPPSYQKEGEAKPMFLFLHGASLSGRDLNRVRRYGPLNAIERGLELDAVVVAPQTSNGWSAQKLIRIVDYMARHYNIDTTRIYVLGMSMGGYGTMDLCATYPERFAAGMAICGGCSLKDCTGLATLPLYIVHGTADRAVGIDKSRQVVNRIKQVNNGELLVYSELKGINHGQPTRLFYQTDTYDWFLRHTLNERRVDRSLKITAQTVKEPYRLKRPGVTTVTETYPDDREEPEDTRIDIAQTQGEEPQPQFHKIQRGDNLYTLARRYKTTVNTLQSLNNIKKGEILRIGREIRVK